jgi:UDP-glucuronate 4-epimerase
MKILITGCAGFIGFHLASKILKDNKIKVYGVDNINPYYDINIKKDRLKILKKNNNFEFKNFDLSNYNKTNSYFKKNKFKIVFHLAAQAGVRYSIENPGAYIKDNINAFFSVIDNSRLFNIKHFIYASTSSVYGNSTKFPLKEEYDTNKPLSIYAATKKSNEVLAYSYSNIFELPTSGMRFFTVYGPYGRPDMSIFKFFKSILSNKKIEFFNKGNHQRDFTYVEDVCEFLYLMIEKPPKGKIPHEVYNIGNGNTVELKQMTTLIEEITNKKFEKKLMKMQPGDTKKTHADITKIKKITKYKPKVKIEIGLINFFNWFKNR